MPQLYRPAWRAERREELERALGCVRSDADVTARVQFLLTGLDFVDAFCDAGEAVIALLDAGVPGPMQAGWQEQLRSLAPGVLDRAQVVAALEARARLAAWVDAHNAGFWISTMWFRYQQRGRSSLLGTWLDEVVSNSA